jgi:CRISPR/Cas system CMR-associated protein Cmr5 small subunit
MSKKLGYHDICTKFPTLVMINLHRGTCEVHKVDSPLSIESFSYVGAKNWTYNYCLRDSFQDYYHLKKIRESTIIHYKIKLEQLVCSGNVE